MDDIVFISKNREELQKYTIEGLKILEKHDLYIKEKKCYWEVTEVPMLGHIVGDGQVRMEPNKVKVILDWKPPTCKKDIQKFNGFCNFYRRYITGYSNIARPITTLMGNKTFKWEKKEQDAFEELKRIVASEQVITLPIADGKYRVEADASGYAIGATLSQLQKGKWRTVALLSRSMSDAELRHDIYNKELLAIVSALKEWRPYLLDAAEPFEIWSDHKNLSYFRKPQRLNGRQARWYLTLQDYNFEIKHILGKANTKADILSRLPWYKNEIPEQKDVILLDNTRFTKKITAPIQLFMEEQFLKGGETLSTEQTVKIKTTLDKLIKTSKRRETEVLKRMKEKPALFKEHDGLLLFQDKIYVPDEKLREKVFHNCHDSLVAGHPGIAKTEELIKRTYWWPSLSNNVKKYVKGCDPCQRNKASHQPKATALHPHDIPEGPWESISVDIVGPLPESKGFNAILAIIDRFSKMIRLIPMTTELSSAQLIELYKDQIWKIHGIPKKITSDRGPQFAAQLMKDLCNAIGIKQNLSTAYHPQTDGQVEQSHQETETFLRHYINHLQEDWADWLSIAEFQYNDKVHTATGHSPFFINYGRHPWKGEPTIPKEGKTSISDFIKKFQTIRTDATTAIGKSQEKMIQYYNLRKKPPINYKTGDKVWLEATNIQDARPSKKLSAKRYGPFKILKGVGQAAYELELPETWKLIHPVFHESLLIPYSIPKFPSQRKRPPPPPEVVGNELEYIVETILDSRKRKHGKSSHVEYLIKWKGYDSEHNEWVAKKHVHAPE